MGLTKVHMTVEGPVPCGMPRGWWRLPPPGPHALERVAAVHRGQRFEELADRLLGPCDNFVT